MSSVFYTINLKSEEHFCKCCHFRIVENNPLLKNLCIKIRGFYTSYFICLIINNQLN
nr:MAG TPA: hypothetical protein [Caudoviricetes sp.]